MTNYEIAPYGRRLGARLALLMLGLLAVGCAPEPGQQDVAPAEAAPAVSSQPLLELSVEEVLLSNDARIDLEIGFITVPENRSAPGRTIQLEVARVRRQATASPETPPIFMLPGGPGFPGVRSMLEWNAMPLIIDRLTSVSDLVVISQRGIAPSVPSLDCPFQADFDLSAEGAAQRVSEAAVAAATACRDHWRSEGVDLPAYSVPEAAADVRDIAAGLGYSKINLWGVSFGSHWSMAVMRFHPEIVAGAVLSGLEGPDHTYDMPSGVLAGLRRMALEASEAEALAAFTPDSGWLAAFQNLIGQLDEAPVLVSVDGQAVYIDGEAVKGAALGYSRGIGSRFGMRFWPEDMHRLLSGEFEPFARAMLRSSQRGLPSAAFFTLDCGSGITAEREAVLNADPAQAILGNLSSFYQNVCPVWEVDLTDAFRTGFETEIPTLLVQGTYDVSTPYSNVQELLPAFANHTLVSIDGGSHRALQEALAADAAFFDRTLGFLRDGNLAGFPARIELGPIEWIVPGG